MNSQTRPDSSLRRSNRLRLREASTSPDGENATRKRKRDVPTLQVPSEPAVPASKKHRSAPVSPVNRTDRRSKRKCRPHSGATSNYAAEESSVASSGSRNATDIQDSLPIASPVINSEEPSPDVTEGATPETAISIIQDSNDSPVRDAEYGQASFADFPPPVMAIDLASPIAPYEDDMGTRLADDAAKSVHVESDDDSAEPETPPPARERDPHKRDENIWRTACKLRLHYFTAHKQAEHRVKEWQLLQAKQKKEQEAKEKKKREARERGEPEVAEEEQEKGKQTEQDKAQPGQEEKIHKERMFRALRAMAAEAAQEHILKTTPDELLFYTPSTESFSQAIPTASDEDVEMHDDFAGSDLQFVEDTAWLDGEDEEEDEEETEEDIGQKTEQQDVRADDDSDDYINPDWFEPDLLELGFSLLPSLYPSLSSLPAPGEEEKRGDLGTPVDPKGKAAWRRDTPMLWNLPSSSQLHESSVDARDSVYVDQSNEPRFLLSSDDGESYSLPVLPPTEASGHAHPEDYLEPELRAYPQSSTSVTDGFLMSEPTSTSSYALQDTQAWMDTSTQWLYMPGRCDSAGGGAAGESGGWHYPVEHEAPLYGDSLGSSTLSHALG